MKKHLTSLLTSIIASSNAMAIGIANDPNFVQRSLDEMIEQSVPSKKGAVDLTLFKKVKFVGEFIEPPKKSKTQYMQSVLTQFKITLAVNYKVKLKSPDGSVVNVYVPNDLAKTMLKKGQVLVVNKTKTIYAYHVYNSKHGPGLLLTDYEK